jgi:hypothetical protein
MGAGRAEEQPLGEVLSKSKELLERQTVVEVDQEAVKALADSINIQECSEPRVGLPLKFDNDLQVGGGPT